MTPEGKVKQNIDRILKPYVATGELWYFKPSASQFGKSGVPDYIGCMHGQMFAVEAKHTPNTTTELQDAQIAQIRRAYGMALIINETNIFLLNQWLQQESAKHDRA